MPLSAHSSHNAGPLRGTTHIPVETPYPVYRISAGRPDDTDIQFHPEDFRRILYHNADGVWCLKSPDERWSRFDIHTGQYVLLDVDALPEAGELVAAAHPGCDEPHMVVYSAGFPPDSDVIGVARLKVTVEVFGKFAA
jgi:hypothetical protein